MFTNYTNIIKLRYPYLILYQDIKLKNYYDNGELIDPRVKEWLDDYPNCTYL